MLLTLALVHVGLNIFVVWGYFVTVAEEVDVIFRGGLVCLECAVEGMIWPSEPGVLSVYWKY